jgi:hypothetical protein
MDKLKKKIEEWFEFGYRMTKLNAANEAELLITGPLANLIEENEVNKALAESLAHPVDSPCGHSSRYAYTEDGGKHIYCYVCQRDKYKAALTDVLPYARRNLWWIPYGMFRNEVKEMIERAEKALAGEGGKV